MVPLVYIIVTLIVTSVDSKATTDSTHHLLEKLGFEKISKPNVNHHKKRLATETHKARYTIDDYNSDTDSHMFVVKLPPHSPYYSPTVPEKFDKKRNNIVTKPPIHFRTNGKPSKVYHWNIPVLKKLLQNKYRSHYKKDHDGDSKIYNIKIMNNEKGHYLYGLKHENEVRYQKHKKRNDIPHIRNHEKENHQYLQNILNEMKSLEKHQEVKEKGGKRKDLDQNDNTNVKHKPTHILTIKELAENGYEHIKHQKEVSTKSKEANEVTDTDITKIIMDPNNFKHKSKKFHKKSDGPSIYSPALPKQNSFYKYFPGNGKPKSFYVIEKSKTPTRYHRLL